VESVFTPQWLERFVAHARTAPWVGQGLKLPEYFDAVRLRVTDATEAVRIDLEGGRPVAAHRVPVEMLAEVPMVVAGSPEAWRRVLDGDEDVAKAVMYRDLYLWQGDIHQFFRRIYFVVELLRLGQGLAAARSA
jgi:hypothetical protein